MAIGFKTFDELFDLTRSTPRWDWGENGKIIKYAKDEPSYAYDPKTGKALGLYLNSESVTNSLDFTDLTKVENKQSIVKFAYTLGTDVSMYKISNEDNANNPYVAPKVTTIPRGEWAFVSAVFDTGGWRYVGFSGFGNGGGGVAFDLTNGNSQINGDWYDCGVTKINENLLLCWGIEKRSANDRIEICNRIDLGGTKKVDFDGSFAVCGAPFAAKLNDSKDPIVEEYKKGIYIPTSGSAVTVAGDNCTADITKNGVVTANGQQLTVDTSSGVLDLADATDELDTNLLEELYVVKP